MTLGPSDTNPRLVGTNRETELRLGAWLRVSSFMSTPWHHSDADGATQTHRKEAIEAKKGTKQEQRAPNTAIQLPTIQGQQILDQSSRAKIKASLAELVTLAAIKPKSSPHEPNNGGQ
jgi:hypothetical protein